MSETAQTAVDVLGACHDCNCQALGGHVAGDADAAALGHEDVFYPLRHHHDDGLALVATDKAGTERRLVWGGGDLIYRVDDDVRLLSTAVETGPVLRAIHDGRVRLDVTLVASEADDE